MSVIVKDLTDKIKELGRLAELAAQAENTAANRSFELFQYAADLLATIRAVFPVSEDAVREFVYAHMKQYAIIGTVSKSADSWGRFAAKCEG